MYCPQCGMPCVTVNDHTCSPALYEPPYEMILRSELRALRAANERMKKALEVVKHDIDADDHPRAWGAAFEALRASVL